MTFSRVSACFLILSALPLTGCEATKDELGLSRRSPDAFAVYQRAPLEMPPDYALRAPQPGQPRPQDPRMDDLARATLLGTKGSPVTGASAGEAELLKQAGAAGVDPAIRQTIDAETRAIAEEEKPTIKRLIDLGGEDDPSSLPAKVVDPAAEAARIKAAKASGQSVTATPTVSVDD